MSKTITLTGIETVRMISKGQVEFEDKFAQNTANKFYSLAA
jgi:tmRNA-binding protein